MKRLNFLQIPAFRYSAAGFAASLVLFAGYKIGGPIAHEFNDSFAMKEFRQYGVFGTYRNRFFNFKLKIGDLAQLETENEKLKTQLALLDQKQTLEESSRAERELASMNEKLEAKVIEKGGSKDAHLPQNLNYQVPERLTPAAMHSLALAYFRKQEFEKSAVIFDHLLELTDDLHYQTADTRLLSAISWYHLRNFTLAKKRAAETVAHSLPKQDIHRQGMIWEALVSKAEGNSKVAQAKLLQFIGEYPRAPESEWINGRHSSPAASPNRFPARSEGHDISDLTFQHAFKDSEGHAEAGEHPGKASRDVAEHAEERSGHEDESE